MRANNRLLFRDTLHEFYLVLLSHVFNKNMNVDKVSTGLFYFSHVRTEWKQKSGSHMVILYLSFLENVLCVLLGNLHEPLTSLLLTQGRLWLACLCHSVGITLCTGHAADIWWSSTGSPDVFPLWPLSSHKTFEKQAHSGFSLTRVTGLWGSCEVSHPTSSTTFCDPSLSLLLIHRAATNEGAWANILTCGDVCTNTLICKARGTRVTSNTEAHMACWAKWSGRTTCDWPLMFDEKVVFDNLR